VYSGLGSPVSRAGSARRGLLALAGVLVLMLAWASAAHADSFTVTKAADTNDGACAATDCSLRDAITAANDSTGADTITISATGTITLTGRLPQLTSDIDLRGPGAGQLSVDGDRQFQPFSVRGDATVSISGLTVTNGVAGQRGGGIQNFGSLTLTGVTVSNSTSPTYGGGIEVASGGRSRQRRSRSRATRP